MPVYTIRHAPALHGEAQINTSKNAVLPILAAALLCGFGTEAKGGAGAAVRMAGCLGIATGFTSGLYGRIAQAQ